MKDGSHGEPLSLTQSLSVGAAGALVAALAERRGAPLCVDASGVQHVGGLCLQVLLAAEKTWAADGQPFEITAPSDGFLRDLALLGRPTGFNSTQEKDGCR